MEIQEQDGVTLQDNTEFKSPMRAAMWDAWWMKARDPKQFLGRWAREGAPLGIAKLIPDSGIFPQVELDESLEEKTDMSVLVDLRNYEPAESQKSEAAIEIERYVKKGFCKILPLDQIHEKYLAVTASRLALILKQKPDGSTKRCIVIDMKRSQGNSRATVSERIVLPRCQDVVQSLRVMREKESELPGGEVKDRR